MAKTDFKSIDEYAATLPRETQDALGEMRQAILKQVPEAVEVISYQIPAFKLNGKNFIYIAGYKAHVSLYPAPNGVREFEKDIKPYFSGKATLQFPIDKPLPLSLIKRIVKYKAGQIENKKNK